MLDRIDAFATPVTLPKWSEEVEAGTDSEELWQLLKSKQPLRHVLTPDFFLCVQAVEAAHFPTSFLASLGSPPSDDYQIHLGNYTEALLASVDRFVKDYLGAMGNNIASEHSIILKDLHNKIVWAYRSGVWNSSDWCHHMSFPLITPTVIKALSDGVYSITDALTEVRFCFCSLLIHIMECRS